MRSRPDLEVYLSRPHPIGGESFVAELRLTSRSDTPCDGIEVNLVGRERRYSHMQTSGQTSHPVYRERSVVSLAARIDGFLLTPGEHRRAVRFALPHDAPPRHRSAFTTIDYDLDVRVVIPWWPDRHARFDVPVALPPYALPQATPRSTCTHDGGPRRGALYLEASLDRDHVPVGGVLRGAVSVSNVDVARVRRIEASFVTMETPLFRSATGRKEVARYTAKVFEGKPDEGAPIPFAIRLPSDAAPTFRGELVSVEWVLELRAVVAFGSDVLLPMRVLVVPAARDDNEPLPTSRPRIPPVGHERRKLVWNEAARRLGMRVDETTESMSTTVGEVRATIELEKRADDGMWSVAHLTWPSLGIDLHVTERRWTDVFKDKPIDTGPLHDRFTVRAREEAQVNAFLVDALTAPLTTFREALIDDQGCALAEPGTAFSVEQVETFGRRVLAVAAAAAVARRSIPPPAAMAPYVAAWRSFADENGGVLNVGRVAIEGAVIDGDRLDVTTRYEGPKPIGTELRLPIGRVLVPPTVMQHLRDERRMNASTSVTLASDAIVVTSPFVGDPRELSGAMAALIEVGRGLRGESAQRPYR